MHKSFKSNPSLLLNNPSIIQEYYIYLKTKLTCDKSIHMIEVEIFKMFYNEYLSRHKPDYLLNTKIALYKERIEPIHLNINVNINTNTNVNIISSISNIETPSEILEKYLEFIKLNSDKEHDSLLNILVYSIIKSGIRNLKIIVRYIKKYRRKVYITCEHTKKRNESEIEYYINVLEVAVEFIERMEYKDLNITKEEYEKLIGVN